MSEGIQSHSMSIYFVYKVVSNDPMSPKLMDIPGTERSVMSDNSARLMTWYTLGQMAPI